LTLVVCLTACVWLPATAGAEVVTIGTPTAAFAAGQSSAGCNCTQYQLAAPTGYTERAPAAGVIIDWRVLGTGTLTLEALRTAADGSLSVIGESAAGQSASSGAVPAHSADIQVLAGDSIGVHLAGASPKIYNSGPVPGASIGEASPDVPPTLPTLQTPGGTLDLNADVAITPVVSSVAPASGLTGATNPVTITGSYLDGATSVKFGSLPVAFTVVSPTEITADAPLQGPGPVDVTVTGQADPSTISPGDVFTYLPKPAAASSSSSQTPSGSVVQAVGSSGLVLSPLAFSASYFLAAPSGASIAKTATGTTLTYTVSAAATTTFVIEDVLPGRLLPASSTTKGPRECVADYKATVALKLPKCTRYVGLTPYLTHRGPAGLNTVHLSGRLNGHALAPGAYRLLATATSTATPSVISASVTHSFRILAPRKTTKTNTRPTAHAALPSPGTGATLAPA